MPPLSRSPRLSGRARLLPLLAALLPAALPVTGASARPVVVELFTSQGCSSCPPAEALLGEMAGRSDLLPLGFHVTYWNRLGWRDTASFEGATERQAAYARRLGDGNFTPQLVVDGRHSLVGSRRAEAEAALARARAEARAEAATVALTRQDGRVGIRIGAGRGPAEILLVGFDRSVRTAVARGENGGRTIAQANVVRSLRSLGTWAGAALALSEPVPAGEDLAVILQAPDGRILGAERLAPGS
ncbi:DUF1223 domain-containing protein [Methylobacterium sp. A54F]